jgi:DNA-binding CsgD family transcriptional regulator
MPRSYRHIKEYEKEIIELRAQGLTNREVGERLGFSMKQVHNFITRYNANQRKLAAGIALKRKGRPPKDYVVTQRDNYFIKNGDV